MPSSVGIWEVDIKQMALIPCKKCGKLISEYARQCPSCNNQPVIQTVEQGNITQVASITDPRQQKVGFLNIFLRIFLLVLALG
jgi:hypothetical protein